MDYNFEEAVRQSLARAREESIRLKHDFVGTEHLLLGLVGDGRVRGLFGRMGLDPEAVKAAVEGAVRPGKATVTLGELPYTGRAKKVLELTMAAARDQKDPSIRTDHLLLGLLREEQGIAAEVLTRLGVTAAHITATPTPQALDGPTGFSIRIDDASDLSIYEQIVSEVTEAVATGELRPGNRMPTVRQLADELDVAPGTVARAYSELERRGVVVTEGARGTRVADRDRSTLSALDRPETLTGLLRPVAVAAFHLGASAAELRAALDEAMRGIFDKQDHAA